MNIPCGPSRKSPHAIFALFLAASLGVGSACAKPGTEPAAVPQANTEADEAMGAKTPELAMHQKWDELLAEFVAKGRVDYVGLKTRRGDLNAYLKDLEQVTKTQYGRWKKESQLVFWINAYNAFMVALVLDHHPIDSVWKITPLWKRALGGPFAIDYIPLGHVGPAAADKEKISLNDIEHEILRKEFFEPRIHVAIVCASVGCPHLKSEAFKADRLDEQLDGAFRDFLADETRNRYDADGHSLAVTPIFKWFAEDFEAGGGPAGFFREYGPKTAAEALAKHSDTPSIEYTDYDWSLNERR